LAEAGAPWKPPTPFCAGKARARVSEAAAVAIDRQSIRDVRVKCLLREGRRKAS
jgi:hypothetical protein